MDADNKFSLRRVELSVSKFNEVAIPHHLDLLRQHRANIVKYSAANDVPRVTAETARARRVVSQLRGLLAEVDALRSQVREEDVAKFDRLTQRSRERTLAAIVDYLETSPLNMPPPPPAAAAESVGVLRASPPPDNVQLQLTATPQPDTQLLTAWSLLQRDVHELHAAWAALYGTARAQAEPVARIETAVEETHENVSLARRLLASAATWRGSLVLAGCAAGAVVATPALLLGGKLAAAGAGAAAAAATTLAARLARRREEQAERRKDE